MIDSDPFYRTVKDSLDARTLHYLQVSEEGSLKKVSFYSRALRVINQEKASEDIATICAIFAQKLAQTPLYPSVQEALESPELQLAKKLYQEQKKICSQEDARICLFVDTLFIKRANLPQEAALTHPDLPQFFKKHHLDKSLAFYGKSVRYDTFKNETYFPGKHGEIPWSFFKKQVEQATSTTPIQSILWLMGPNGVQVEDLYDWDTLRPVKRIDGWERGYKIEICTCCIDEPRLSSGDHCWLRLYTSDGFVYSVGQYRYREKEITLAQSKMFLQCPDVSEFWDFEEIQTTHWDIDEEKFEKIKEFFEETQRKVRGEASEAFPTYDPIKNNCTAFALKALKIAGIEIPAVKPIWHILIPSKARALANALDEVKSPLLKTAIKIAGFIPNLIATFLINTLQYLLGASKIFHEAPHNLPRSCLPRFATVFSLFDYKNASMAHPFIVSEIAQKSKKQLFKNGFLSKELIAIASE